MKSELQQKLLKKYPEFFQTDVKIYTGENSVEEDVKELINQKEIVVPIQFGFECNDGWYFLLDNLMYTILQYCKNNDKPFINITQIKEKYGSLSFYYTGGDDMIDGMVWFAESLSYRICETCGATTGVGHTQGWVYTICWDCLQKNKNTNNLKWVPTT